ncbi:MAG: alpha/beta fold hydrolase [Bdellovibrio sp.]|jgi:pimeloyl-ACP methyl ester carboxylesterase
MQKHERDYFFGQTGQRLFIQEWGALNKPVVLMVHGFPGCANHGQLMSSSRHWDSFRLIAMDRPGYGQSDFQENLTPLKFAEQVRDLLDDQGINEISILSVSGGAPYSMALAFLLQARVRKVTSIAGVAPLTLRNFSYMNQQQRKTWAMRNFVPGTVLNFAMNRVWKSGLDNFEQLIFTEIDTFSEHDRKVLLDPSVGPFLLGTMREALRQGPGGILQDMRVYSKSWGFPLSQIQCPVTLWHGSEDDVVHHYFAQDMQERLPRARLNLIENEGHYSLPMNCRDAILGDLLGQ